MGGVIGKGGSPKKAWVPETKLEAKMVEAMQRRASGGSKMKSFNSIILKFPKIDESFRKCKSTFEQFDEDSNNVIDQEELRHCFNKLEFSFSEEEINDLFEACDINDDMGIKFNEFIVLLCLVHLLKDDPAVQLAKSKMGLPDLETTFETLVDAFVFLDKNKDGHVSKNEMVDAINETACGERSSGQIAMKRFGLSLSLSVAHTLVHTQKHWRPSLCTCIGMCYACLNLAMKGISHVTHVGVCEFLQVLSSLFSPYYAEEMDWDKNGMVNFKEFLFAFTRWVGIDEMDDEDNDEAGEG